MILSQLAALAALTIHNPAPAEFDFLIIATAESETAILSPLIRDLSSAARPASAIDLGDCDHEDFVDLRSHCVRALLPARTIAFMVDPQLISNVTGSVVHRRDRLICIGPRGVGRIQLGRQLGPSHAEQIAAGLPGCIAAASAPDSAWGGGLIEGGLWRFPLDEERIAADGAHARGRAAERAIVRFTRADTTHRNTGRCSVAGRIIYVESGTHLRAGDRFELAAPCRWEGPDRISRMFTQGGMIPGWTGRISISYRDGAVEFVEPL